MTHEQYLAEPCETVDWTLALADMEDQVAVTLRQREARKQQRGGPRR